MTKLILIQCQSITYFYNALGVVFSKYPDETVTIDVVLTNNNVLINQFMEKIKKSKYIRNIYPYNYKPLSKINEKINKLKKTKLNLFIFNHFYKPKIFKILNNIFNGQKYTDIVYSQETKANLISYLKIVYPDSNFILYGDGSGLLIGSNSKLDNPFDKSFDYNFFKEIKPDEIIAIAPFIEDNSIDISNVPISSVNKETLLNLIKNDEKIQKDINTFTNEILNKYSCYKNKILLLTSQLDDPKYKMTEDEQISIYLDIINDYCPDKSLVVLKLHPVSSKDIISILKQKSVKQCEFIVIPDYLKSYPIEMYYNLLKNLDFIITFLSSSSISLNFLYSIKTFDAYDVIQKYPLKDRVNSFLNVYREIINRKTSWDKKSLIYKCDLMSEILEFYQKYGDIKETETKVKLSFLEQLFSIKNRYSKYGKKKQIVILGIKIKI